MASQRLNHRRRAPGVESLEAIQLLSASLVHGIWTINGTAGADTIAVSRVPRHPDLLQASQNGHKVGTVRSALVREIHLNGLGGNDTLKIDESHGAIRTRAVLSGGAGKNMLIGGSGATALDGGPSKNSVLQPGTGPTTLARGIASDSARRFGSVAAFRQFLSHSSAKLGRSGVGLYGPSGGVVAPVSNGPMPPGPASGSHSTTNVQVPGVDEADTVETDGTSLFVLSRSELVVVDASHPDALAVVSRTTFDGSPLGEYLDGSRLTVISSLWQPPILTPQSGAGVRSAVALPGLWFRGVGRVQVTTFDVSDPAQPQVVERTALDGSYSGSRMVDGQLELVLQSDLFSGYWGVPVPLALSGKSGTSSATPAGLVNAPVDRVLPQFVSTVIAPDGTRTTRSGLITQPQDILQPATGDDLNLTSVVLLDTRDATPGPTGTASLLGSYASTIHVTPDRIYLFSPHWDDQGNATTSVYQFNVGGSSPALAATGTVPGELFDQYAADASGGDLRVATSAWQDASTDNGLYVLRQQGNRLNVVGMVDHLAPGESITSARFKGDRAFLVTFRQVDPLWTIDLSNPTAPTVAGKLTMPGFSRFLQPIDDNTLLGIGREVDPGTGETTDLKLSLFDVHDLAHPALIATQAIAPNAAEWTWSDAEWDPHALGWFPELGVVAIPVQGSGPAQPIAPGTDPSTVDWTTTSDLEVFHIDATAGAGAFASLGQVDHKSSVTRSVRIGDVLYSIADQDIQSVRVINGGLAPLGQVAIQTDTSGWSGSGAGGGVVGVGGVVGTLTSRGPGTVVP